MEKLLSIFLVFSLFFGCEKEDPRTIFSGIAMTVPYRIVIRKKMTRHEKDRVDQVIRDIFWRTHFIHNKFNPASELSYINQLPKGVAYTPSPPLWALLNRVDRYVKMTKGLFDPTIENKDAIGWDKIVLQENHLIKSEHETRLDLGGVAKGTTLDELLLALKEMGYPSTLVEWGGDFALSTDDRPWHIELFDPQVQGEILELYSGGLATSGDYQQFWTKENQTFFHVYHPREKRYLTQQPGHVMSVSVLAPTAEEADLLATTLLLLETKEKGEEYLKSLERNEIKAWYKIRPEK